MKEIPSAAHLAGLLRPFIKDKNFSTDEIIIFIQRAMKDFAKMHVEAALEAAATEAEINFNDDFYRDKIIASYPETNIK